jgi:hypothetical protein
MLKSEIPIEVRPKILEAIRNMDRKIYADPKDRIVVIRAYVKYQHRLYPGETIEGKVQEEINCKTFTKRALSWARKQSQEW